MTSIQQVTKKTPYLEEGGECPDSPHILNSVKNAEIGQKLKAILRKLAVISEN
jgi:hypothetical protein